ALAVVSGAGFSFFILNGRYGTGREEPFKTFVQMFLWGSLMMGVIAFSRGEIPDLRGLPLPALLALAHLALLPTLASYGLISFALKHISGTAASITSMSEIVFAGVMAWVFLGEAPAAGQVKGALLIVTAVLLLVLEGKLSFTDEGGG
ncbi:MAG: EamA family transporter, partial [Thermovirgaceae bacterium]